MQQNAFLLLYYDYIFPPNGSENKPALGWMQICTYLRCLDQWQNVRTSIEKNTYQTEE